MTPKVKTFSFKAETGAASHVKGIIAAPTKLLARLNIGVYCPGLRNLRIGNVVKDCDFLFKITQVDNQN